MREVKWKCADCIHKATINFKRYKSVEGTDRYHRSLCDLFSIPSDELWDVVECPRYQQSSQIASLPRIEGDM